jgi:hypothetical protein
MDNRKSGTLIGERPCTGLPSINLPLGRIEPENTCHHYWLIDQANGPFSHAVCRFCREERDFRNSPFENIADGKKLFFDIRTATN